MFLLGDHHWHLPADILHRVVHDQQYHIFSLTAVSAFKLADGCRSDKGLGQGARDALGSTVMHTYEADDDDDVMKLISDGASPSQHGLATDDQVHQVGEGYRLRRYAVTVITGLSVIAVLIWSIIASINSGRSVFRPGSAVIGFASTLCHSWWPRNGPMMQPGTVRKLISNSGPKT